MSALHLGSPRSWFCGVCLVVGLSGCGSSEPAPAAPPGAKVEDAANAMSTAEKKPNPAKK